MESLLSLPSSPPLSLSSLSKPTISPCPLLSNHHHRLKRTLLILSPRRRSLRCTSTPTVALPDAKESTINEEFDWYAHWYPVAPLCDLDKRRPHGKRVMGLDVVVWWDRAEERWRAFDDRCPHRLAPLSEGRIDQWGRLQCVYHGWCFDGAGSCKFIPQAPPDGPPVHTFEKACAASYPTCEQNKILWFWPRTDPVYRDILIKKKPPYIPELDDPSFACSLGMRELPYGYEILAENLLDPAHVRYAHYGILRTMKDKDPPRYVLLVNSSRLMEVYLRDIDRQEFQMLDRNFLTRVLIIIDYYREGGKPIDMRIETSDITGFVAKQDRAYNTFIAPCLVYAKPILSSSNGSVSSQNIQDGSSGIASKKQQIFRLVFLCIPVSPGRSRLIWSFPRNFSVWIDETIPRWLFHVGQNLVLDSDIYLLHVEEHKIAEAGPSKWLEASFVPTKSDAQVVAFRKWLKKYSDNQVNWGTKFNGYLPPTPPREQLLDRYWSHTVQCSSCNAAVNSLKAIEVSLHVVSIASIAFVAAAKQSMMSTFTRTTVVSMSLLCFLASKWLSHFIYKTFYYHDYDHAFK